MPRDRAVRAVACFELAKGALVLAAGCGLLSLVHEDVYAIAAMLIEHTHLNPAAKYPRIFMDAAANVGDSRLMLLGAGAALYAVVRLVEGYGLFVEAAWAEVLAASSGAIYVPFEVLGLAHRPSWHGAVLLIANLAVVGLMVRAMLRRRSPRARDRR